MKKKKDQKKPDKEVDPKTEKADERVIQQQQQNNSERRWNRRSSKKATLSNKICKLFTSVFNSQEKSNKLKSHAMSRKRDSYTRYQKTLSMSVSVTLHMSLSIYRFIYLSSSLWLKWLSIYAWYRWAQRDLVRTLTRSLKDLYISSWTHW